MCVHYFTKRQQAYHCDMTQPMCVHYFSKRQACHCDVTQPMCVHYFSKRQACHWRWQPGRPCHSTRSPPTASAPRSALAAVAPTAAASAPKLPQPDRPVWNRWRSAMATVLPSHCRGSFLHGPMEKYWGKGCLYVQHNICQDITWYCQSENTDSICLELEIPGEVLSDQRRYSIFV